MLIGLTGKAGSGKDSAGQYMVFNEKYNFKRYAFADCLKKNLSRITGIPGNYFYDRDKKEEVLEAWGKSPRELAQLFGTEVARYLHPDIWIRALENEMGHRVGGIRNSTFDTVITDVRFENEADWIRSNGGHVVHVHRDVDPIEASDHITEKGIEVLGQDYVLMNTGKLSELKWAVDALLESISNE